MSDRLIDIPRVVAATRRLVETVRRCYIQQGEGSPYVYTKEGSLSGSLGRSEVQRAAYELSIALNPSNRATAEGDILRLFRTRKDLCTQLARIWERLEKHFPIEGTYFKHEVEASVLMEVEAAADYLESTLTEPNEQGAANRDEDRPTAHALTVSVDAQQEAQSTAPHDKQLASACTTALNLASSLRAMLDFASRARVERDGFPVDDMAAQGRAIAERLARENEAYRSMVGRVHHSLMKIRIPHEPTTFARVSAPTAHEAVFRLVKAVVDLAWNVAQLTYLNAPPSEPKDLSEWDPVERYWWRAVVPALADHGFSIGAIDFEDLKVRLQLERERLKAAASNGLDGAGATGQTRSKLTDDVAQPDVQSAANNVPMLGAPAQQEKLANRRLEDLLEVLNQTKAEPTSRALEIGARGYEPSDPNNTPIMRCKKQYLNLAEPCYDFVKLLWENGELDVLAEHADLEPAPSGNEFPYTIPPVSDPSNQVAGWHLAKAVGTSHSVARARLLLWLAVAKDSRVFGEDWLFYQRLLAMLGHEEEHSGRIHPMRRVERWVREAAQAIVNARRPPVTNADDSHERTQEETDAATQRNVVVARRAVRSKGGRPSKWADLRSLIKEFPELDNKALAAKYNQKYGAVIGSRKRDRADATKVAEVRYNMNRRADH